MKNIVKKAFTDTIPILTGYVVLGFGFGIILKSSGFGILHAFIMSLCIYAGSMQYVAVGLLSGGASLITTGLTTLIVNARHLFYGISMLDEYKNTGKIKPYLIFALTDETYSLVCNAPSDMPEDDKKKYYFLVSVFNHMYWVMGTLLGAFVGSLIQFNSEGIDFALTALFITVLLDQWLTSKKHGPAIIGVVASVLCLVLFGAEKFLIPAMLVISLMLCLYREEKEND